MSHQLIEETALLRDLVSKGRAAGIIVLAATQRPSTDIVAGSLRALFAFRWALRCSTPDDSDTILGRRWAARGWSTDTVDAADRGVGLLRHEGRSPVRVDGGRMQQHFHLRVHHGRK